MASLCCNISIECSALFYTTDLLFSYPLSNLWFCVIISDTFVLAQLFSSDSVFFRQLVAWHRPFCVDLEESTFTYLRNFLESYCDGIGDDTPPAPFLSKRYDIKLTQHTISYDNITCYRRLSFIISV